MIKFLIISILFFNLDYSVLAFEVWNQKEQLPAVGRHRASGLSIGDKGYVGLGHMNGTGINIVYSDWWEFDQATNSWTQKSDFPVPNYGASTFTVGNKGYVGGGAAFDSEFYEFNPVTNTWTQIANCLSATPSDDTAFGIGEKGYVKDDTNFYEYTPETDSWVQKSDCPLTGWAITSFVIQDKGYVKSGSSIYEYKPSVDQWTPRASFPGLTTNGGPGFSIRNKGYIVTGYSSYLNPVNSEMWEYDPSINEWSQIDDFPGVSRRFGVAFNINNKGYFGLGTNGTNLNDFWEFNPALNGLSVSKNTQVNISLFPNPAKDRVQFTINSSGLKASRLLLYSQVGTIVKNIDIESDKFSVKKEDLPSGIYFYQLIQGNGILTTGKIIFE